MLHLFKFFFTVFVLFSFNNLPTTQAFVNEYEAKLNELCDKCKEMKQIYNKVLVRNTSELTNLNMGARCKQNSNSIGTTRPVALKASSFKYHLSK